MDTAKLSIVNYQLLIDKNRKLRRTHMNTATATIIENNVEVLESVAIELDLDTVLAEEFEMELSSDVCNTI